jgi:hypothetical protein
MTLRGGVKENDSVIKAVATELRAFLTTHKGMHIGTEELEGFYKRHFPQANLNIINGQSTMSKGTKSIAESSVSYTDDMKDVAEFQIFIQSKSPMDIIKWLFQINNNKKPFYVTNRFIQVYIHEYIHFMQRYLKPIDKAVHRSISAHSFGNDEHLSRLQNDILNADRNLVYVSERGKNFSPEVFRLKLMQLLNKPEYASDMLVKDELKFLIRHAQAEKQAYEIEMAEGAKLRHPKLMKNRYYRAFITSHNKKTLDSFFRFEDKIRIMKEEYFRIIQQERYKNQLYLEIINS